MHIMKRSRKWPIKGAIRIGLVVLCLIGISSTVQSKNLGQVGPVYPIVEKAVDFEKLSQKRREETYKPLSLPNSLAERQQYLDLTYTVPRDITDAQGKIVYPKGYRYNPLAHRRFRTMLVIDGSDPRQVDWLDKLDVVADPMTRIVITQGDTGGLSQRFERRVYRLHPQAAKRFRIDSVPTIVQQKGAVLAVTTKPVD
jgi:conjugal transfer pilus assembly protein TraW